MGAGSVDRFKSATAFLPALALALFSFWSATFYGGATAAAATVTWLAVLAVAGLGAGAWRDPLDLGPAGRLLTWALLVTLGVALVTSPVPRAGLLGVVTLPAWLLLPAAVARCWRSRDAAGRGLAAISLVVSAIAATALFHWLLDAGPRPAMPLGHHNLLAGWLVLTTPLALAGLGHRGVPRFLAGLAGILGSVTILATGSLTALVALSAQLVVAWLIWRRRLPRLPFSRPAGLLAAAAIALLAWRAVPRLVGFLQGHDGSLAARRTYLEAGWRGFLERPLLGWGPGSVPWTVGAFLRPAATVHPASEVVGDLHSLPVQLAFEIGLTGLLLSVAIVAIFLLRRLRECLGTDSPRRIARLGLVSLAGGLVFLLGSAPLQIPAVAFAVVLAAGASLTTASSVQGHEVPGRRLATPGHAAYATLVVVLLLPATRAHVHYDRAVGSSDAARSRSEIARAEELDPGFPLYPFRLALLDGAAEPAARAAAAAPGLAPIWLEAGVASLDAGSSGAFDALLRAHRLDPLAPLPAFHLMRSWPDHPMAPTWGARALAADPRLGAALWWEGRATLWDEVLLRVAVGAPETAERLAVAASAAGEAEPGDTLLLALGMDRDRTVSFSLFAFRRRPWPGSLAPVRLRSPFVAALEAPRATIPD